MIVRNWLVLRALGPKMGPKLQGIGPKLQNDPTWTQNMSLHTLEKNTPKRTRPLVYVGYVFLRSQRAKHAVPKPDFCGAQKHCETFYQSFQRVT